MDVLVLIGRLLFIGLFAASGVNHLTQTKAMAGYAASRGLPLAVPATVASGLVMLVGAVSVGVFKDVSLGGAALVLFAFFAYAGHDLGLMVTGPAFSLG
ncbi:DoxX family protein [Streptomyces sp. NPDC048550]|uniref:DoxX family protein n=1 Tax=Streptomyces sp. NPDC048550 TaxID=3155739 RepID=UPI00342EDD26